MTATMKQLSLPPKIGQRTYVFACETSLENSSPDFKLTSILSRSRTEHMFGVDSKRSQGQLGSSTQR